MYEYEFDIAEARMMKWFRNGSTPNQFATFEDLAHYTEFQFRVKALTLIGPGPFSEFIIGMTPPAGIYSILKHSLMLTG